MSLVLMGKKEGMAQIFDERGNVIACSIILIEPNAIVQIKNREKDGYLAIQLGAIKLKKQKVKKPMQGHFAKAKVEPCKYLVESRMDSTEEYTLNQQIDVSYFSSGDFVDIVGTSKGKGYQGVMKLHGFAGGPAAHGSGFHRHAGSTGMRSTPGRCFPGGKRASRMGGERITVQNLEVVDVDRERKLLLIKGGIPGCRRGIVYIRKAKKRRGSHARS